MNQNFRTLSSKFCRIHQGCLLNSVRSKGLPTGDSPLRSHTHKVEQGLGVLALRIKTLLMVEKNSATKGEGKKQFLFSLLCLIAVPN